MLYDDIMLLVKAGFTAQQIAALQAQQLPPAQAQQLPPAQAQQLPPAQAQQFPPAQAQQFPPAQAQQGGELAELKAQIAGLTGLVQRQAMSYAQQPGVQSMTTDQVLAEIIDPSAYRQESTANLPALPNTYLNK